MTVKPDGDPVTIPGPDKQRSRQADLSSREYRARINRVIDHIRANLDGDLSLESLARVACFSAFHFHRIFRANVGETCHQFIKRIRLERAAARLLFNPQDSITEIALDCGFSSGETFARSFRDSYGMNASQWRTQELGKLSKKCKEVGNDEQTDCKGRQAITIHTRYHVNVDNGEGAYRPEWRITMIDRSELKVEVKPMPEMNVAYIRHIGPYKGDAELFGRLFGELFKWAGARGLIGPDTKVMSLYYDDSGTPDEQKHMVTVCLSVPPGTPVGGEIGTTTVPGGEYAVAHFELLPQEYGEAWDMLFTDWLPQSGYQPADGPCYELYLNNPEEHPEKKHIVDICLPVKPL